MVTPVLNSSSKVAASGAAASIGIYHANPEILARLSGLQTFERPSDKVTHNITFGSSIVESQAVIIEKLVPSQGRFDMVFADKRELTSLTDLTDRSYRIATTGPKEWKLVDRAKDAVKLECAENVPVTSKGNFDFSTHQFSLYYKQDVNCQKSIGGIELGKEYNAATNTATLIIREPIDKKSGTGKITHGYRCTLDAAGRPVASSLMQLSGFETGTITEKPVTNEEFQKNMNNAFNQAIDEVVDNLVKQRNHTTEKRLASAFNDLPVPEKSSEIAAVAPGDLAVFEAVAKAKQQKV